MTSKRILIVGATSGVAQAVAQRFAQQYARIFCLARNPEKMAKVAESLGESFAGSYCYDFTDTDLAPTAIAKASEALGGIDIALFAHGDLLNQLESEHDYSVAQKTFAINQLSVIAQLIPLSAQMERQGAGKIGVITSVAGDRGRPRNYTYGAAKGSLNIFVIIFLSQKLTNPLLQISQQFADRYPLLHRRITVTHRHGIIFQRVKINGDAERGADFVLVIVAFADIAPIIPGDSHVIQ